MGFLGFGKKDRIIDLGERYRKQQERLTQKKEDTNTLSNLNKEESSQSSSQGAFNFLGNLASSNAAQPDNLNTGEDKKKKFAKRLIDMTTKIEDLSNQIYHLQQRVELLEKKTGIRNH